MKYLFIFLILLLVKSSWAQGGTLDSLSFQNLKLELYSNYENIGTATGFVIEKNHKYYLITNLHVVSGVDYFSQATIDPQLRKPNIIAIWHNAQVLGNWTRIAENLYDSNNNKQWIECSVADKILDLVALPLKNTPKEVKLYPFHLNQYNENIIILPGFALSIIGFPFGLSSDGELAIWKTGHLASDFDIDANGLPLFMIDATTRPGMSGSIVVLRMSPYLEKDGTHSGIGTRFLGIYTAQSNLEEIGFVLKPIALKLLFDKLP
jgi:hypothetical protein